MFEEEPDPQKEATDESLEASPEAWAEKDYSTEQKLRAPKGAIFETRLEAAWQLRQIGNDRVAAEDLEGALVAYRRAFWHVDFDLGYVQIEMTDFHQKQVFEAQAPLRLNVAQCVLKQNDFSEAKREAEAVLEACQLCADLDSKWERKARYWHGKALLAAGRYDDAEQAFAKARDLDPGNDKLIRAALADVKQQRRDLKLEQRSLYDGKLGPVAPPPDQDQGRRCVVS